MRDVNPPSLQMQRGGILLVSVYFSSAFSTWPINSSAMAFG